MGKFLDFIHKIKIFVGKKTFSTYFASLKKGFRILELFIVFHVFEFLHFEVFNLNFSI